MELLLLYLLIGTVFEMYLESQYLVDGKIAPEQLLDFETRLIEAIKWPYNMYKYFRGGTEENE